MKHNLIVIFLMIVTSGFTQKNNTETDTLKYCVAKNQTGSGGFDLVSYFQSHKPVAGKPEFAVNYDGVKYLFSTEVNKNKFLSKPALYLPQFGGWCSMTLVMGRATTPTYDNFAILAGKLYLFERTLSVNGRELWLKNIKGNEKIATENYNAYRTTGRI